MTEQEIVNIVLGQPEVEDNEGVDKISNKHRSYKWLKMRLNIYNKNI